jgi:hypothetical protein
LNEGGADLTLLLAGFRRGSGIGALAGFLLYAVVLLRMDPADAGPLLGLAAGMLTALVGGAFAGGIIGAYVRVLRGSRLRTPR